MMNMRIEKLIFLRKREKEREKERGGGREKFLLIRLNDLNFNLNYLFQILFFLSILIFLITKIILAY